MCLFNRMFFYIRLLIDWVEFYSLSTVLSGDTKRANRNRTKGKVGAIVINKTFSL